MLTRVSAEGTHGHDAGVNEPVTVVQTSPSAADTALVGAIRTGDEAAFEEVFRRYYATVYRVLLRLTGTPEEAEDLAQETFLRLYQRPLEIREDTNLGGYLYRIATNLGFNAIRSRQRSRHRWRRWAGLEWPTGRSAPSAASEAEARSEAETVRRVLAELPERDRTVLVLRYSGVSYAEIAAAINVRPGSVGTILARAERAMRAEYERQEPHEGGKERGR